MPIQELWYIQSIFNLAPRLKTYIIFLFKKKTCMRFYCYLFINLNAHLLKDGHEICFVGDEAFRQLSQVDPKGESLLQEVFIIFS